MAESEVDQLRELLRAVLEKAISEGVEIPVFDYAVLWWEPYDAHGSTGRTELRERKDLGFVGSVLSRCGEMQRLLACSQEIRAKATQQFGIDRTAEILCEVYLSHTDAVMIDENALQLVAETFVRDVQREEYEFQTILQVERFSAQKSFQLSREVAFRPIESRDIECFGREHLPVRASPRLNKRDWLCTITEVVRHDDWERINRTGRRIRRVIGSLGLTKEGCSQFSILSRGPTSPFLGGRDRPPAHWMHSAPSGNNVELDDSEIDRYQKTYRRVDDICDRRVNNLFVAFRRFCASSSRSARDDKITDLVIAIESLLIPQHSSEIGFRFELRGAALLPERLGSVDERMKLMKLLYRTRSEIVHGGDGAKDDKSLRILHQAIDVFRIFFSRFLTSEMTVKEFISKLDQSMCEGAKGWLDSQPHQL